MTDGALIPVTVLTGFLGSGKTTILSRVLRERNFSDTAVIVNEFGAVGLDHLLVESTDESIIDLSCGCICCTIRGDLMATLIDLHKRREAGKISKFRRVVIETTGLADPAPIIHTLMQEPTVFTHYRLSQIVTAVDAVNGMEALDRQSEAVKQVAVADAVLVTKTDITENDAMLSALEERLENLNPTATISHCVDGVAAPNTLFYGGIYDPVDKGAGVVSWLAREKTDEHHSPNTDRNRHGDGINTFALHRANPVSRGALAVFMQMLADQKGDELLRLKGIVVLSDDPSRPAVVHGIQHVIHPIRRLNAWPSGEIRTSLVFIVRGIEQKWIEDLFDRSMESAYADLPV
jgi:G3E family GTPase